MTHQASVALTPIMPELASSAGAQLDQPITARLAGAGSLRRELEALLSVAPVTSNADDYRRLLMDENAAGKASANARMWMWKRLKLRYALGEPSQTESKAFRWAMAKAATPADRGLVAALMMARTDRLFREVVVQEVSPLMPSRGKVISPGAIKAQVQTMRLAASLAWSDKSISNVANHLLSSLKDFGIVEGSRERRTVGIRITPVVATFAAMLGRAQGLTDRQNLDSIWFQFLGATTAQAVEALYAAAKAGLVMFRMQADVVEMHLPELSDAA